jgi:heme/copper-type cytochrome/quinol oxidase subunit 4
MSETVHRGDSDRRYVAWWAILVAALVVSLALGAAGASQLAVVLIFAVAAGKAWLVVSRYMHLAFEPRWVALVVLGALAVVLILYFGLVPDIVWVFGRKPGT